MGVSAKNFPTTDASGRPLPRVCRGSRRVAGHHQQRYLVPITVSDCHRAIDIVRYRSCAPAFVPSGPNLFPSGRRSLPTRTRLADDLGSRAALSTGLPDFPVVLLALLLTVAASFKTKKRVTFWSGRRRPPVTLTPRNSIPRVKASRNANVINLLLLR